MRKINYLIVLLLLALPMGIAAQSSINLTPVAKSATVGTGEFVFPESFTIATGDLGEEFTAEVAKFATVFNAVTGYNATIVGSDAGAAITLALYTGSEEIGEEGYTLDITAESIAVKATHAAGFFYAFQSIKKMLPACVMAEVKDENVTKFALPVVSIIDSPRFGYRGFMLDVSRHFFTVEEVKRMLDVMAYYKMNRFHWHLTDDQGWRVEIKKYPKLTTVGSIAPNSRFTDMEEGQYWINRPYGPYFYTQEELKEVVAYAKEKHIEIIPEIDMPGHFVAALVAYPEFSCNPTAGRSVWIDGGVSSDVLNVANPAAVQFAKDILTELADIFPYEQIHIGGDECPTSAWEGNAECQARVEELGLSSYRELQSRFIGEMSEHLATLGRKISVWNEAISNQGADTDLIKSTDATVYAWTGARNAANKAAGLGLKTVYTPQFPFYINRVQSTDPGEPAGAGNGSDATVQLVYNEVIIPSTLSADLAKYYTGIQGTFWAEHVSSRDYLEYLALPRLTAIAESGWSPEGSKNFSDFQQRITKDTLLLNYNGYYYGRHYILDGSEEEDNAQVMPKTSTDSNKYWYRIVTKATDARANKCLELLRAGSPLIAQYSGKSAAEGKLWTNEQVGDDDDAYEYQWWAFEKDPDNPGNYALVCMAQPDGSVNPTPSSTGTGGRWSYDNSTKHYSFILGDNGYGVNSDGNYFYSIRSANTTNYWMNASMSGQGFAANVYNDPASGNGGRWSFLPIAPFDDEDDTTLQDRINDIKKVLTIIDTYEGEEKQVGAFGKSEADALAALLNGDLSTMTDEQKEQLESDIDDAQTALFESFGHLEVGKKYRFTNAIEQFAGSSIATTEGATYLQHMQGTFICDAWTVVTSNIDEDYTQTVTLTNDATGNNIGAGASSANGKLAYPVSVGTAASVEIVFDIFNKEYDINVSDKSIFPIPFESQSLPGIISSGSVTGAGDAPRLAGAAWKAEQVYTMTITTVDYATGEPVGEGTYTRSVPAGAAFTYEAPAIDKYAVVEWEGLEGSAPTGDSMDADIEIVAKYSRVSYDVTTICRDQVGAIVYTVTDNHPVGYGHIVAYPELDYYTFSNAETANGTEITPDSDVVIEATYTTTATNGVRTVLNHVTELVAGRSYVLYDTSPNDAARIGYCKAGTNNKVLKSKTGTDLTPEHTWILEASGTGYKVKNGLNGLYVPTLVKSGATTLSATGDVFTFKLNSDNTTWTITGTNNLCWDGLASGDLVGWNNPGHPFKVYEYIVEPYFNVTINTLIYKAEGEYEQYFSVTDIVKAGSKYTLNTGTIDGYVIKEVTGDSDRLDSVDGNLAVNIILQDINETGIDTVGEEKKQNGIYDLSGRKLKHISDPGIYIIDGVKTIVK